MTSEVKKDLLALLEVGHSSFHKFGRLEDEWVFILPILVKRIVSQYSGVATNPCTFQFLWDSQIGSILSLKKIIITSLLQGLRKFELFETVEFSWSLKFNLCLHI